MAEHVLFLTGHLAAPSLKRTLDSLTDLPFSCDVCDIGIQVAGLMTASMIQRRAKRIPQADKIIVPGLCSGDLGKLSAELGVTVEKGPVDLKDLPEFFGKQAKRRELNQHKTLIFAEIVDAPDRNIDSLLARAHYYRQAGADVIDLGCLPEQPFDHLEDAVQALVDEGFTVSVDSLNSDELLRGAAAGAHYLLSLKESSLWIADEVSATPVLIPERGGDVASLYRAIDALQAKGRAFFADAILDPINFGFSASIVRYHALRARYPDVDIFMGVGNVTELTDADTAGVTAILCGIAVELGVGAVLSTQVSAHAQSVIRETDLARRIMFAANQDNSLPRGYDNGLMGLHDKKPFPNNLEEIAEIAAAVKDPSFRIQVTDQGICIYNRDGLHTAENPFDLFERLKVKDDGGHAFYLGVELGRAQIAWQLGKRYLQDQPLDWGVMGPAPEFDEVSHEYAKTGATLKSRHKKQADADDS